MAPRQETLPAPDGGLSGARGARLSSTIVLLLQLRLLLTAIALLQLAPDGQLPIETLIVVCAFALLTWLIARYWRRMLPHILRHPWLVGADAMVGATILIVDGPTGPFFLATVLTCTIAGTLFGWRGLLALSAAQCVFYYSALIAAMGALPLINHVNAVQLLLINPLLYPIAGFVGTRLRVIFDELESEQRARVRAEHSATMAEAAAEERARLARDMHDSLAKTLRGTAMAAQALPLWVKRDPERAGEEAQRIAEAANTAVNEARGLIADLRDHQGDTAISSRIAAEVEEWTRSSGVPARLRVEEPEDAPFRLLVLAEQETVAILKEALSNVDQHARARSVTIDVCAEDQHLVLRIEDDGRGFGPVDWDGAASTPDGLPEPVGHYGLLGMHERAHHAGGSLSIRSAPWTGARITVRMPLSAQPASPRTTGADTEAAPAAAPS